jgi:hypothetical protein
VQSLCFATVKRFETVESTKPQSPSFPAFVKASDVAAIEAFARLDCGLAAEYGARKLQ